MPSVPCRSASATRACWSALARRWPRPLSQEAACQLHCRLSSAIPDLLPVSPRLNLPRFDAVADGRADPHQPDGFLWRSAARTGDAGDCERNVDTKLFARAHRHFSHDLLAHRAMCLDVALRDV